MSLTLKVARARANGRARPGVGDPGLFGFIGSAIGKVASVAKSLPGPIGWAGQAVSRIMPKGPATMAAPSWQPPVAFQPPQQPAAGVGAAIQRFLPGGETGMEVAPIGAPSGYHVNKTDYFLKDGTYIPKESRWVRNRHRNPLNPSAASKAIGRLESLTRAMKRFKGMRMPDKCCKK